MEQILDIIERYFMALHENEIIDLSKDRCKITFGEQLGYEIEIAINEWDGDRVDYLYNFTIGFFSKVDRNASVTLFEGAIHDFIKIHG